MKLSDIVITYWPFAILIFVLKGKSLITIKIGSFRK